jgi:hypothetical protein
LAPFPHLARAVSARGIVAGRAKCGAFNHVEHTYRIIKAGFHPNFWWFADVANSHDLLSDILWTKKKSTISSRNDHSSLIENAFKQSHAIHDVTPNQIPDAPFGEVFENLRRILATRPLNAAKA